MKLVVLVVAVVVAVVVVVVSSSSLKVVVLDAYFNVITVTLYNIQPMILDSSLVHPYFPYLSADPLHDPGSGPELWVDKNEGHRPNRRPNRLYDYDHDDEDDDRANAITIAVLLIMGVAFIVGVVFLIYSSSNVKAEYDAGDKDSVDLMNAVYQRRIADIITETSRQHQLSVKAYQSGNGGSPHESPTQGQGQGEAKASDAALPVAGSTHGKKLCPIVPLELSLLKRLRSELARRRLGKLRSGVLLLHDNAPAHRARQTVETAERCGFYSLHTRRI
ncbi:hypothetical protein ElyMa_001750300 [Elysia marginata]|uniref:Tc1-like transposase DDE domain-containing protein n=1 Tax=Elysia marginata TaxID=1093978 RepID=A0AAV4E9K6_9GAST|nr:hypothetical protein ElyMa_001750300 [Elysia marginata]